MKTINMAKSGFSFFICLIILASMNGLIRATRVFKVGDELGWQEPDHNTPAFYSQWAQRNRFLVGDSLSFEYKNDSVIEVDKWGYYHCNASHPISAFNNGKSVFNLDKPGPFYFISGTKNHCKKGQRFVVEVMGRHHHYSPPSIANPPDESAPSPQPSSAVSIISRSEVSMIVVVATVMAFSWHAP